MKRLTFVVAASCFLFAVPVLAAEETELVTEDEETATELETEEETETEMEFEKGSRLNPYKLGEEAHLGTVYEFYDDECEYVDVSITLEDILDADTLEELYPDDSISNGDYVVVKGSMSTGVASSNDDEVDLNLDIRGYSSQLDDCYADICNFSNASKQWEVFSYFDYDIIIKCFSGSSGLPDVQYIRFEYYPSEESYNWEDDIYEEQYIWFELQ